jgi:hemerythrin
MLVTWKDKYSTGIDEIDGHHKKLFQLLNESQALLLQDDKQEELSQLLDELIDYTSYHFSIEEDLMVKGHYQGIDRHLIEHFGFRNKVLSFKKEIAEGKGYLSVDIFDFIRNWLVDHILEIDAEMSKALCTKQCN